VHANTSAKLVGIGGIGDDETRPPIRGGCRPGSPLRTPWCCSDVAIRSEPRPLHRGHSITTVLDGVLRTYTVGGAETYDYQLDAVAHALTTNTPADTEGRDSVATMAVIDAIYLASGVPNRDHNNNGSELVED
jgi:hypothetical protein